MTDTTDLIARLRLCVPYEARGPLLAEAADALAQAQALLKEAESLIEDLLAELPQGATLIAPTSVFLAKLHELKT